jgi:hypothetical protein
MVMSVTSQRIVAQIVPLGMALASPLALLCVPDSLMAQAVELLQGRFGGNEIESMIGINLLRLPTAHSRVAQPDR